MARNICLTSDEAVLVVDLLEDNYRLGASGKHYADSGVGADLAAEIRQIFGMLPQPKDLSTEG